MGMEPIVRRHLNGMYAVVTQSDDKRFIASVSETAEPGDVTAGPMTADLNSMNLARNEADQLAHPGCDGACPGWQG
jgi:hypothetical protein